MDEIASQGIRPGAYEGWEKDAREVLVALQAEYDREEGQDEDEEEQGFSSHKWYSEAVSTTLKNLN